MNTIMLVGRLGKDAEFKYLPNGTGVVEFSLAVSRYSGDEPDWFTVSKFGESGEKIAPYLTKGKLVGLLGRMEMRKGQDKEGNPRTFPRVVADRIEFLGKKEGSGSAEEDLPF